MGEVAAFSRGSQTRAQMPYFSDAIHPCGCYHVFYPTGKLRAKPRHPSLQEPAYASQRSRSH